MAGRSAALSLLAWLVLALAWTWPAAGTPDLVGLHPDAAGTVWFLHAAPGLEGTGHPVGVTYGRPDSWLLMLWALLPVDPVRLHAWLGVLGVLVYMHMPMPMPMQEGVFWMCWEDFNVNWSSLYVGAMAMDHSLREWRLLYQEQDQEQEQEQGQDQVQDP